MYALLSKQKKRDPENTMNNVIFIFYVRDQDAATQFYQQVLRQKPRLCVPGMTEFLLTDSSLLGLIPEAGIKRLLGDGLPDPANARRAPRAELYLRVDEPAAYHERVLQHGGHELSGLKPRAWGDDAAYSLDLDGHVLAFASPSSRT